jgi:flagellar basal body-associated protein FliL
MSAAAAADAAEAVPKKGKKKLIILIAAVVVLLGLAGGGAVVYLKSKAAAEAAAAEAEDEDGEAADSGHKHAATAGHKKDDKHVPPVFVPLDPFVVNLADREADRFAQVGITLEVADAHVGDEIKAYMPAIRNNILAKCGARRCAPWASSCRTRTRRPPRRRRKRRRPRRKRRQSRRSSPCSSLPSSSNDMSAPSAFGGFPPRGSALRLGAAQRLRACRAFDGCR